jgi:CspA family cold shock protein
MIKGTLKFFNAAKGFGFITPDGDGKDVFLPATTIAACGGAKLQAGQRVSFEQEADVKGPKAVQLKLLDETPAKIAPPAPPRAQLTIHCDPSSIEAGDVLAELAAAGRQPRLMDYTTTPPDRAELQRMSLVLRNADQSLVRRYNPLFLDLQLDDRFIAESDFWTAIVEHPALINGPVLVEGNNIRICKTASDVRAFLGQEGVDVKRAPKEISPRMAAMMRGQAVPPAPSPAPKAVAAPASKAVAAPVPKAVAMPAQKIEKPAAGNAVAAKAAAKPKIAARAKPAAKPKKAAAPVTKPASPAAAKKTKTAAVQKKRK